MEGLQRYVCNNIKSIAGLPNGRPAFLCIVATGINKFYFFIKIFSLGEAGETNYESRSSRRHRIGRH